MRLLDKTRRRQNRKRAIPLAALLLTCLSVSAYSAESVSIDVLKSHFADGDFDAIISALDAKPQKSPEAYNLLISALMNKDLDDAEEQADKFVAAYPDDYRAYHIHASVMGAQASDSIFSALGYAKKARQSLEKAVDIAPDKIDVYQALMQFHLAAPSIAGGDMDEARRLVDKIATMDATEGQFASARFHMAQDNTEKATELYLTLAAQDDSRAQALFELGRHYVADERYQQAFETLSPLMSFQPEQMEAADTPQWQAHQRTVHHYLYGKYYLGLAAVKSGNNTQAGIEALSQYRRELAATNIDTANLPSHDWAALRLAELLINNKQYEDAQTTLNTIEPGQDDRFNSIFKGLKKKVKKHV
ncbi:tetratricopeptide repeat protein [Alteromonas halophila]|uniref:Tetratricopeptide repeat protein n=1 Tax=Alteromonas halophila TaxID=516698 RepID=A0A918JDE8_9ALTE|nr:tetratricopeptide repeat protein [Alteromonas halophila]GGW75792.1 hypothetical protein GCM10007391_05210 [Alteromonas halophila]